MLWEFFDHEAAVSAVAIEDSLHLFASCSQDGSCNVYSLSSGRLVSTLQGSGRQLLFAPAAPAKIVLISERTAVVYSLAGDLIGEYTLEDEVSCAIIARDVTYNEFLVHGTTLGAVKVRSTVDFSCLHEVWIHSGLPVSALSLSKNRLVIIAGLDTGEVAVVVDSESIVKLMEKRMKDAHHALSNLQTRGV